MSERITTKTVMTSKMISEVSSETITEPRSEMVTRETPGPDHDGTSPVRAQPLLLSKSEHQ